MIDFEKIDYSANVKNEQAGLVFYYTRRRQVVNFLIQQIGGVRKMSPIKVEMHPDRNHARPHIHVNGHKMSFAIDTGQLLAGKCKDLGMKRFITDWIFDHQSDLLQLWNDINKGLDREQTIKKIVNEWEYEGVRFKGKKPSKKIIKNGIVIFYEGTIEIKCSQDNQINVKWADAICAIVPADLMDRVSFSPNEGNIQIKSI